jgi:hypothetical protein
MSGAMTDDFLFLTTGKAAEYLSCSRDELIAWVKPDRRMPGQAGPGTAERRWSKRTLDRAKPHIETWRARDRAEAAQRAAVMQARDEAAKARRKGMRKSKALTSGKVCATLLALSIWRLVRNRNRLPNSRGIAPVLDARVAKLCSSDKRHSDLWATFKFKGQKAFSVARPRRVAWQGVETHDPAERGQCGIARVSLPTRAKPATSARSKGRYRRAGKVDDFLIHRVSRS